MDEPGKTNELEGFEVTELDDRDLDDVAGGTEGCINGNCSCSANATNSQTCTNGNCSCTGSTGKEVGFEGIDTTAS